MSQSSENIIHILLDAGRGEVAKLSIEATVGQRVGELPRAYRKGYEFAGWFTEKEGGEEICAGTLIDRDSDFSLYARYARSTEKKRSMFRLQRRALIILLAAVLLLGVGTFLVYHFVVDTYTYEDPADGTVYYIRKVYDDEAEARIFKLTYSDGSPLPTREYMTAATEYIFFETDAGSWVEIDENGKASTYAVVDTDGDEQVGFGDRVLMFPSIPQSALYSIEVINKNGSYTVYRNAAGNTFIKGCEELLAIPDEEVFASLCSNCGYTLSALRIKDPIRDPDGSFASEYGLDGSQKYTITKAAYDSRGNLVASDTSYTVYIGDALPSDGGYYAQLEGRDKVYVFSTAGGSSAMYHTLDETVLAPVENLVAPMFSYPMDPNGYYDVREFFVVETGDNFGNDPDDMRLKIEFSFVQTWERTGTLDATQSYRCDYKLLSGFNVNGSHASNVLYDLYRSEPVRCVKLLPCEADLAEYGLLNCRYLLHYGMWIDMTEQFTDGNGALLSGFLPSDAKQEYRNFYTSSERATDGTGTEYTFDVLIGAAVYGFKVTDDSDADKASAGDASEGEASEPEVYEYRVTTADKFYFYGGSWLKGDALEAELGSNAYSYRSEYACDYRYDAATGCYYFRKNGFVYYGRSAVRASQYDSTGADVSRLLINAMSISEKTADNTYFVYNELCGQIIEVGEEYLSFLEWESMEWVDESFFPIPLAYVTEIDLTAGETHIDFKMDNSKSDQSEGYDSTDINIKAEDSDGNRFDAWGRLIFNCTQTQNGQAFRTTWIITESDYSIRNTDTGEVLRYSGEDTDVAVNAFGETVKIVSGTLVTTDGARVTIGADWVTVTKDGEAVQYPRYTVKNFRQFYKALMYATLEGSADLGEADEALRDRILEAIRTGDESACQLVLRIGCEDVASTNDYFYDENHKFTYVFRFYQYTKGKSYITVQILDENGEEVASPESDESFRFYVRSAFVEKLIADAKRVMRGEAVVAESKT